MWVIESSKAGSTFEAKSTQDSKPLRKARERYFASGHIQLEQEAGVLCRAREQEFVGRSPLLTRRHLLLCSQRVNAFVVESRRLRSGFSGGTRMAAYRLQRRLRSMMATILRSRACHAFWKRYTGDKKLTAGAANDFAKVSMSLQVFVVKKCSLIKVWPIMQLLLQDVEKAISRPG